MKINNDPPMKKEILIAATAALLSLPLALHAADQTKKTTPFLAADTNGDGKVSPGEFTTAMKGKMDSTAAKAKFAELDMNKDGALSREEFNAGNSGKKTSQKKKAGS
jgi:hypothetical protein